MEAESHMKNDFLICRSGKGFIMEADCSMIYTGYLCGFVFGFLTGFILNVEFYRIPSRNTLIGEIRGRWPDNAGKLIVVPLY